MLKPFEPNASTSLAISTVSASVTTLPSTDNVIRLHNSTTGVAFVRLYTGAGQTAVNTDLALAAGSVETFTKNNATGLSCLGTVAGTLYITTGNGAV